ncbi:MAG: hypothetical protein PHH49_03755 [Candidatus Omnitrophica bacterium]|nr:hypothetical protein [Candidatus Omnitrophota bacterium]MDD5488064.1 hypothetical protein [Candidatus Omnitrophota bacterium]
MSDKNKPRKKYLNRSLQSRYLIILALSMVVPTVLVGGCLYYLIFTLLADQILLPDVVARDLIPVITRINAMLLIGLPGVFALLLTWASVLSYRFIAPLERLEYDIRRIDEGDYSIRLEISEDHDLKPVADVINDLVAKLDKRKEDR